jgi:peroxiredoxin Q/BCP
MIRFVDCTLTVMFVVAALTAGVVTIGATPAIAVEAGQPAPDFKLPATTGTDIALSDYRGKKWVLLEFYGADFVPT